MEALRSVQDLQGIVNDYVERFNTTNWVARYIRFKRNAITYIVVVRWTTSNRNQDYDQRLTVYGKVNQRIMNSPENESIYTWTTIQRMSELRRRSWFTASERMWKRSPEIPVFTMPEQTIGGRLRRVDVGNNKDEKNETFITKAGVHGNLTVYRLAGGVYEMLPTERSSMPNVWVFSLVVLAILVGILSSTLCAMQYLQRRRRAALRRRIRAGQVDLTRLGVKALTVPQDILSKLPVYTYDEQNTGDNSVDTIQEQQMCTICLEEYISRRSRLRRLPCAHTFHQACVDTFLRTCNAVCPLCKRSVLPRGYCPRITNSMVQRDRAMRLSASMTRPIDNVTPFTTVGTTTNNGNANTHSVTSSGTRSPRSGGRYAGQTTDTDERNNASHEQNSATRSSITNTGDALTTTTSLGKWSRLTWPFTRWGTSGFQGGWSKARRLTRESTG